MLLEMTVTASLFALFLVLTPGAFALAALERRQWLPPQQFSGNFVLVAALGSIWVGLVFLLLFRLHAFAIPQGGMLGLAALDLALVAVISLTLRPWQELRAILSSFRNPAFLGLLAIGLVLGAWATRRYPHVFDSGQLLWTQHVLWEQGSLRDALLNMPGVGYYDVDRLESMFGFSGLIAPLGSLYPDVPLVTLAAGLKPFMLVLLLCTCSYIVEMLDLPHKRLGIALLVVAMLGSQFGYYGVLELAKDSIYGVLFCTVFLTALAVSDRQTRATEAAILFCAASVTGVIAVPYMLVALGLWLVFAADLTQTRAVMRPFLAVNTLILPLVVSAMLHKPLWPLVLVSLVGSVVILFLLGSPRFAQSHGAWQKWADRIAPSLPLFSFALAAALLPVVADMPVWTNADGSVITERRAPLDGQTGMLDLFFVASASQKITVAVALIALVIASFRRTSRTYCAVAAMPFAVIAIVLIHLKLKLGFLSVFNQWDLIKDVPMWLGGTFISVIALQAVGQASPVRSRLVGRIGSLVLALFAIGVIPKDQWLKLVTPGQHSELFASANQDLMTAGEIVWEHLPNRSVLAGKDVLPGYFFSLQMYGGRPSQYNASSLNDELPKLGKIGLAVPKEEIFFIAGYAREKSASLTYMAPLAGGNQAFLIMEFDGQGRISLPDLPELQGKFANIRIGVYDQENVGGGTFRWAQKAVTLDVPIRDKLACVRFRASAATIDERPKIVHVKGDGLPAQSFNLKGSALTQPQDVRITASSDQHRATLQLEATMPEIQFPNDGRKISWAIFTPIQVDQGKSCGD